MPTYEYKCDACGHAFEKFHSMTAEPIRKCPACKKNKVKRLIGTGAGLIFKGSGFYITDYGKDGKKDQRSAPAKAEGAGTGAGEGGSSGGDGAKGTESKPSPESKPAAETKAPAPAAAPAPKSSGPSE
jgi:putative FmdB family regulatory protein